MLAATLLAIGAAILHAGWNFAIKQSGDRWLALWGQFFVAGIGCVMLVFGLGGVPAVAWGWAVVSGLIHVAYAWFLARAYDIGEFSVTYPMARGCGAVLAAIGGVVLLGDTLSTTKVVGVGITAIGLWMIAGPADGAHVRVALAVASTICMYTIVDSHGSRATGGYLYPLAAITTFGALTTLHGIALGRRRDMIAAFRINWLRFAITGAASFVTYWMVLVAVQHASVGYVTALRESSVIIAALVGVFVLKEPNARRRVTAACIAVGGLVILVVG